MLAIAAMGIHHLQCLLEKGKLIHARARAVLLPLMSPKVFVIHR
jgi:hypothetical protein